MKISKASSKFRLKLELRYRIFKMDKERKQCSREGGKTKVTTAFALQTRLCYLVLITGFFMCACSPAAAKVLHLMTCIAGGHCATQSKKRSLT